MKNIKLLMFIFSASFGCLTAQEPIAEQPTEEPRMLPLPYYEMVEVTEKNLQAVLDSDVPVILDVYAPWCPPCRRLAPVFEQLHGEWAGQFQFAKLNGDQEFAIAEEFNIRSFPTLLFIKDGKEVDRYVGYMDKQALEDRILMTFPIPE